MFTVIGSGFGMYGYLPAMIQETGGSVVLPVSFRERIQSRVELRACLSHIQWVETRDEALSKADGVVIAVPPMEQAVLVSHALRFENIRKFILEKPLAVSPEIAASITSMVNNANRRLRVGYTLLFARWHEELNWPKWTDGHEHVTIRWTFMAHHFANDLQNWKRKHSEGGGVLRFFGVHLLALLAEEGYTEVIHSTMQGQREDEPECWVAAFSGQALPDCTVHLNSRCGQQEFRIVSSFNGENSVIVNEADPFHSERSDEGQDKRVNVLRRLIRSFDSTDQAHQVVVVATNQLWQEVEVLTKWAGSSGSEVNLSMNFE